MPVLRQDLLTGEWVIIATERARRPETFAGKKEEERSIPPARVANCPFCPGNEDMTPPAVLVYDERATPPGTGVSGKHGGEGGTAAVADGWTVRVIPNKFPALERGVHGEGAVLGDRCGDLFRSYQGYGVHEVIIETPDHNRHFADLEEHELGLVLKSFEDRIVALSRDQRLKYVQVFRNHQREAGASIEHPHCQLIALPYIPPLLEKEYRRAHDYYLAEGRCLLCSLLEEEERIGDRIVLQNDYFTAFIPFAAPLPFSAWIVPREHYSSLEVSAEGWEKKLAPILGGFLERLSKKLGDPPYNMYLHSSPLRSEAMPYFHWHLEIIPKLTIVAGWELATGTYINVSLPEEAAGYLKVPEGEKVETRV